MIYLYEYGNRIYWGADEEVNHFFSFLEKIWAKRKYTPFAWRQNFASSFNKESDIFNDFPLDSNFNPSFSQQFVQVDRQNHLQAKNYVGIIRFNQQTIHLLPKIFYPKPYIEASEETLSFVHHQLMRWLAYSTQITFPLIEGQYSSRNKTDLAEIMLFTFAHYTHRLLQEQQFTTYEPVSKNTAYVKGRLQTAKYVTKHLSGGKWQELPCEFDQYGLDNTFNQILKCTVRQLQYFSQNTATQDLLQQILQSLTNVSTKTFEAADCDSVQMHPLFEEWQLVLNYCRLFLASSAQFSTQAATKALAFLIPMEQLYEHFVYGFLQKHFPQWQPTFQDNSTFLATDEQQNPIFQLQYDISLTIEGEPIILDCKYKIIHFTSKGKVKGIDIKDMYQIAAYAVRRGCKKVFLVYPNTLQEEETHSKNATYFDIVESFSGQPIRVWVLKIPMISRKGKESWEEELKEVFLKLS